MEDAQAALELSTQHLDEAVKLFSETLAQFGVDRDCSALDSEFTLYHIFALYVYFGLFCIIASFFFVVYVAFKVTTYFASRDVPKADG